MADPAAVQKLLAKAQGESFSRYDLWRYTLTGYLLGVMQGKYQDTHHTHHREDVDNKTLMTPDIKTAHWKAIDRTARSWEERFSTAALSAFNEDKRNILAIAGEAKRKALRFKASIDWTGQVPEVKQYLETQGADNWRETFTPRVQGIMTAQGQRWATDLGMQFSVRSFFAEAWFDTYMLKFAQPINDTTLATLGTVFQQAQAEGWSVPEMQKHLTQLFDQWMKGDLSDEEFNWYADRLPPNRTEMIARTETMRASNAGSNQLFTDWGVKQHEWLSNQDDRTREAHLMSNIDPRVVPIDQPFTVGGEQLMYPGDPAGSPENTINCRCTVLPVVE